MILEREAVVLARRLGPDLNADAHEDDDEMVAVAAELRKLAK